MRTGAQLTLWTILASSCVTPEEDTGSGDGGDGDGDGPGYCQPTCEVAADCPSGSAAFDEDNFACNGGKCDYLGCNSDEECNSFPPGYACLPTEFGTDFCQEACETPADCGSGGAAHGENNYSCEAGACEYTGCLTDEECQMEDPATVCVPSGSISFCEIQCETPADCGMDGLDEPAYDEDNFECVEGQCLYLGCNSDEECNYSSGSNWVCEPY